jgi:hypothetical protein
MKFGGGVSMDLTMDNDNAAPPAAAAPQKPATKR